MLALVCVALEDFSAIRQQGCLVGEDFLPARLPRRRGCRLAAEGWLRRDGVSDGSPAERRCARGPGCFSWQCLVGGFTSDLFAGCVLQAIPSHFGSQASLKWMREGNWRKSLSTCLAG